ncbi:MAG: molybdopterin molybdotransferase MoeA [Anaerolineae bacterium]
MVVKHIADSLSSAYPYPLISMEEAWRRIAAVVRPLKPVRQPLASVLGCVLAEDVIATTNIPAFPASAMDGYAVIAADTEPRRLVIGDRHAGPETPLHIRPGTAARIMTGAPLPDGADAVIPVERTTESGGIVQLHVSVAPGDYVRPIGQDLAAGDVVLEKGSTLGPAEIGLLAAIGHTQVLVYPKVRVAVMATGDELVPPESTPGPGQIRDSNSSAILAAVESVRAIPMHRGLIPDDKETLRTTILDGVARADMLITCGGVSMGAHDYVKPLLAELGTIHFGRVAVKPGKPLTFAEVQGAPVFGLPGFPVSSLVSFELFVRPALRLMAGQRRLWRPEMRVRLSHDIQHEPDRVEFQRAKVTQRDGTYWAVTTGSQVSGRLQSLVGANALLRLPAGETLFHTGDEVTAIMIEQPEVWP